jgi:hypothetical protein
MADRLFVFGEGSGACYVEAYSLDTGKPLTRFSTNEWKPK